MNDDLLSSLAAHVTPVLANPWSLATTAMMATIVFLQFRGAPLASYSVITYPSYKIFKQVFASIILLALLGRFSGAGGGGNTSAAPVIAVAFWGGLFAYSIVEYRFLLWRNRSEVYLRVKTRKGLLDLYDRPACNLAISVAAGIVRHMREEGIDYADYKAMQELYDAFEFPSAKEQDRAVREQMRVRREALANDRIFALEAEQIRKEMEGAGNDGN
jgi:hypothetical protein